MPEPKKVSWGYVSRDTGNGKEILIAHRVKSDDPLRANQLILPGGGLEDNETYSMTAVREVREETGILTLYNSHLSITPDEGVYRKNKLHGYVDHEGFIHLTYVDSGKQYKGRLVFLLPSDPNQEPSEQPNSDARDPHYIALIEAFGREKEFTPACQVLLDIIRDGHFRVTSLF